MGGKLMRQSSFGPIRKKKKPYKKYIGMGIGLCSILVVCFILLKIMYTNQNITLQNTWQSKETGQIITFDDKGYVTVKGKLSSGIYHILSPNTMEYTIDGKTFEMKYHIVDQTLYWGLNDHLLESFQLVINPFNYFK